jgi:pSer/pThr/pTyr-binding forkhead associated (FHA) protein
MGAVTLRGMVSVHDAIPPSTTVEGATRETSALSPLSERDRVRSVDRSAHPGPGRYIAVPDGDHEALVPLREPTTRLGRSHVADVVLDDSSVSRRHALVVRRGDATVLCDDRSLNGVFVNGHRITERPLADGDEIALGKVVVRYVEVSGQDQ